MAAKKRSLQFRYVFLFYGPPACTTTSLFVGAMLNRKIAFVTKQYKLTINSTPDNIICFLFFEQQKEIVLKTSSKPKPIITTFIIGT